MRDSFNDKSKPAKEIINSLDIDGNSYLHKLAEQPQSQEFIKEAAFALGADVNLLNKEGLPPLYVAIRKGNLPAVEALIDCGANLYLAIKEDRHFNAVCSAAYYGDENILKLILNRGGAFHLNKDGFYFNSSEELPALHMAIIAKHDSLIKPLIKAGAFLDHEYGKRKLSALQKVATLQWSNSVKNLYRNGADLNKRQSETGDTALHIAARSNHYTPLSDLLKMGANPDIINNNGYTPLMEAVIEHNLQAVKALLDAGANPNITDKKSNRHSALHLALIKNADHEIISLLVRSGTDPLIANHDNRLASSYINDYMSGRHSSSYYYSSGVTAAKRAMELLEQAETDAKARFFQKAADKAQQTNKKSTPNNKFKL